MKSNIVGMRSTQEIPQKYRRIFSDYNFFNSIQTRVFDDMLLTNKSVVVSAPTGSGKTVIFELAIVQLLMHLEKSNIFENYKMVYVAPTKALCSERTQDWMRKFALLGISCLELTGDSDIDDFSELEKATLVVTTPEKWDSVTRRWKDNENMVKFIKLFMIDEVHLLNEDIRGPTLETVVSRMKTIQFAMKETKNEEISLRFVAVSATIPNIEDLAVWLGGKDSVSYYKISEEYRPVKLKRLVFGYNTGTTGFKFDMSLNYKLASLIKQYSNGKPTLIFCSSRKAVEMSASVLFKEFSLIPLSDNHKSCLIGIAKKLHDAKLKSLVVKGIAYHHAGLNSEDRGIIEDAFRKAFLLILVCTNTLATGVNLPAHLVIIKSTEVYIRGTVCEYPESSILQMIGRAGRPQYDVCGIAIIMTHQKNVAKYENLMNGSTPIESHLHKHLAEHLNSEIVLQTVTDLVVAMEWIRSTFLYVRAVECPANYGFAPGMTRNRVEKELEEMCLTQINALEANDLVIKDRTCGLSIRSTIYGRLMARYYLSFETMKTFRNIEGNESLLEIFNIIIQCKEFSEFKLRVNEKRTLNELNDRPIRFPIKGKIKSAGNKISCLIQAHLGNLQIQEPSLLQDGLKMVHLADRISKCLSEYIRLRGKDLNFKIFKALLNSVTLAKSIKARLWENSLFVSKQLKKIGPVYSTHLVNAGKTTFKSLLETDATTLETILNKPPPIGKEIHDAVRVLPNYEMIFRMSGSDFAEITVSQLNEKYRFDASGCSIIIGDTENNLLLYHDKVDNTISECGKFYRKFKLFNPGTHIISAHLIHGKIVGVDKISSILINEKDDDFKSPNTEKKKNKSANKTSKPKPKKQTKKNDSKSFSDEVILLEDDVEAEDPDVSFVSVEQARSGPVRTSLEKYLAPQVAMMKSVRSKEGVDPETNKAQTDVSKANRKNKAGTSASMNYEYLTGDIPEICDIDFDDSDIDEIVADMMNDNVDLDDKFLRNELELPFEDCVVDLEDEEEQHMNILSTVPNNRRVKESDKQNLEELIEQNHILLASLEHMDIGSPSKDNGETLSKLSNLGPGHSPSHELTSDVQSSTNYIQLVEIDQDIEMANSASQETILALSTTNPCIDKIDRVDDSTAMEVEPDLDSELLVQDSVNTSDSLHQKQAAQITSLAKPGRVEYMVLNDVDFSKEKEHWNDSTVDIADIILSPKNLKQSELLASSQTFLEKAKANNLLQGDEMLCTSQTNQENFEESEPLFEEEVPNSGVISLDTLKTICRTSNRDRYLKEPDQVGETGAITRASAIDKPNTFAELAENSNVFKCNGEVNDIDRSQSQKVETIKTVAQIHSSINAIFKDSQESKDSSRNLGQNKLLTGNTDQLQRRDAPSRNPIIAPARLLYPISCTVSDSRNNPSDNKDSVIEHSQVDGLPVSFFGMGIGTGHKKDSIMENPMKGFQYDQATKKPQEQLELSQSIFSNLWQPKAVKQIGATTNNLEQGNPFKDTSATTTWLLGGIPKTHHSIPQHSIFSNEPLCGRKESGFFEQNEPINLKATNAYKNIMSFRPEDIILCSPIDLSKPKNCSSDSESYSKTFENSDRGASTNSGISAETSFLQPSNEYLDGPLDLSVCGSHSGSGDFTAVSDPKTSSPDQLNESLVESSAEQDSIESILEQSSIDSLTQVVEDEITCGQELQQELSQNSQEMEDEVPSSAATKKLILDTTVVLDSPSVPLIIPSTQDDEHIEPLAEDDPNLNNSLQMKEDTDFSRQHESLEEHGSNLAKLPESVTVTNEPKKCSEINDPAVQPDGAKSIASIAEGSKVGNTSNVSTELLNKSAGQSRQAAVGSSASKPSTKQTDVDKNCVFDINQPNQFQVLEEIVTKKIPRKRQNHPISKYKIPRIVLDLPVVDSYDQFDHGIGNKFLPKNKPATSKMKPHKTKAGPSKKEEPEGKTKSNRKYTKTFQDLMHPKNTKDAKKSKREKSGSSKGSGNRDEYKIRSLEPHKRKHEKCKDRKAYKEKMKVDQYKKFRSSRELIEEVNIEGYVPPSSPDIETLLREFENKAGSEVAEGYEGNDSDKECDEIQDFSRMFDQNLTECPSVFQPSPLDFL